MRLSVATTFSEPKEFVEKEGFALTTIVKLEQELDRLKELKDALGEECRDTLIDTRVQELKDKLYEQFLNYLNI